MFDEALGHLENILKIMPGGSVGPVVPTNNGTSSLRSDSENPLGVQVQDILNLIDSLLNSTNADSTPQERLSAVKATATFIQSWFLYEDQLSYHRPNLVELVKALRPLKGKV